MEDAASSRANAGKASEVAALHGGGGQAKLTAWCKAELGTGAQLWWEDKRKASEG